MDRLIIESIFFGGIILAFIIFMIYMIIEEKNK